MSATTLFATAAIALAVTVLVLLLWWGQEHIVFQPPGPPFPDTTGADRLEHTAADGQALYALRVAAPARNGMPSILLAFHGNADLASRRIPWAREVARRTGWDVVLPEFRGYGGLPGRPTAAGVRKDARAAAELVAREYGASVRVALYGHSLGSAVAAELAAELDPAVLLLESPFTSARNMARMVVARPFEWIWDHITRVHYDTAARVHALDATVSVAHGDRDMIVPVRMGRQVFAAARHRGALLIVPGAGHNDLAERAQDTYWHWIEHALP